MAFGANWSPTSRSVTGRFKEYPHFQLGGACRKGFLDRGSRTNESPRETRKCVDFHSIIVSVAFDSPHLLVVFCGGYPRQPQYGLHDRCAARYVKRLASTCAALHTCFSLSLGDLRIVRVCRVRGLRVLAPPRCVVDVSTSEIRETPSSGLPTQFFKRAQKMTTSAESNNSSANHPWHSGAPPNQVNIEQSVATQRVL